MILLPNHNTRLEADDDDQGHWVVNVRKGGTSSVRVSLHSGSRFVFSRHCKAARAVGLDEARIVAVPHWQTVDVFTAAERAVLAYTDCLVLDGGRTPDGVFAALKSHLSDDEILELTYVTTLYEMHATICRALRLEYDDVEERVTEVVAPGGRRWM